MPVLTRIARGALVLAVAALVVSACSGREAAPVTQPDGAEPTPTPVDRTEELAADVAAAWDAVTEADTLAYRTRTASSIGGLGEVERGELVEVDAGAGRLEVETSFEFDGDPIQRAMLARAGVDTLDSTLVVDGERAFLRLTGEPGWLFVEPDGLDELPTARAGYPAPASAPPEALDALVGGIVAAEEVRDAGEPFGPGLARIAALSEVGRDALAAVPAPLADPATDRGEAALVALDVWLDGGGNLRAIRADVSDLVTAALGGDVPALAAIELELLAVDEPVSIAPPAAADVNRFLIAGAVDDAVTDGLLTASDAELLRAFHVADRTHTGSVEAFLALESDPSTTGASLAARTSGLLETMGAASDTLLDTTRAIDDPTLAGPHRSLAARSALVTAAAGELVTARIDRDDAALVEARAALDEELALMVADRAEALERLEEVLGAPAVSELAGRLS